MKAITCEKCGPIPYALVDGYAFGDTILEGVMFKVELVKGKVKAVFAEPDNPYVAGLNAKKWTKECRDCVNEGDGCDLQCPTCNADDGDVQIVDSDAPSIAPAPITQALQAIKAVSFDSQSIDRWNAVRTLTTAAQTLIDAIGPCTCHEAFTSRKLRDPACNYHRDKNEIEDLRTAIGAITK